MQNWGRDYLSGQSLQKNINSCKIEEEIIYRDSPRKKKKLRKRLFVGTVPAKKYQFLQNWGRDYLSGQSLQINKLTAKNGTMSDSGAI